MAADLDLLQMEREASRTAFLAEQLAYRIGQLNLDPDSSSYSGGIVARVTDAAELLRSAQKELANYGR